MELDQGNGFPLIESLDNVEYNNVQQRPLSGLVLAG